MAVLFCVAPFSVLVSDRLLRVPINWWLNCQPNSYKIRQKQNVKSLILLQIYWQQKYDVV